MKTLTLSLLLIFLFGNNSDFGTPKLHFEKISHLPKPVFGMTYVTDGELIYSIGGGSSFIAETNNIFAFRPKADKWIKVFEDEQIPPFNFGWGDFFPEQNKIIFMGGWQHGKRSHGELTKNLVDDIFKFNVKTKNLEVVTPNIHPAVNAGVATWKGKMYIFGGSVPFKNTRVKVDYTDVFHEYNPRTGEWFELPKMPVAKVTKGRIVNGVLYIFGGKYDVAQKEIHQYDIEKRAWSKIGVIKKGVTDFSIAQYKDHIFLIGDGRVRNSMHVFNTQTKKMTSLKTNIYGIHSGAIVLDGKLYIFGGIGRNGVEDDTWMIDLKRLKF